MKLKLSSALAMLGLAWTIVPGAAAVAAVEPVAAAGSIAATDPDAAAESVAAAESIDANALPPTYEKVRSFSALGGLRDFDPIDERTLIVWRTPFHPYLVELAFPSRDLRFAHAIGIHSHSSTVYARFDSVLIKGIRYPIDAIYKLTRDEARELRQRG